MHRELRRAAPRRLEAVPALREAVVDVAAVYLEGGVLDDVALVVSELLTNALWHSSPASDIRVEVSAGEGRFVVTVENLVDVLRPPPAQAWRVAEPTAPSGRGLGIVIDLAPEVAVSEDHGRVAISVSWPTVS